MLLDDGHLRRVDGGVEVAGAIERVELPPTIQALLTARIDRLSNAERGIVERASIEGQVFHLGALAALGAAPDGVLPTVRMLTRKQLFRSDQAALPGQDAYRFRHILIREAAYERVAKEVRARWHEAFADWLEGLAGGRISEYEELLGHHLAEAARYRLEIGDNGTETHVLARRAAALFRQVADRAAAQGDFMAAAGLLRRVAALLPADDPARPIAIADCAGWLLTGGHMDAATALSAAASAAAEASGDRPSQLVCEALGRMIEISASAEVGVGDERAALDHAHASAEDTERAGRLGEAARLWYLTAIWEGNTLLRCAKAREAAERTLELGQRIRSPWLEAFGAVAGVVFLLRGRGRIPDLLRVGEERASGFGRAIRADYLADTAVLLAQRGEVDAALATTADLIAIAQELGYKAYVYKWVNGTVLLDAGQPVEAIEALAARGHDREGGWGCRLGVLHHRAARPRPRPGRPSRGGGAPKHGSAGALGALRPLVRAPLARRRRARLRSAGPASRSPGARRRAGCHPGRHRLPRHRVPRPPRRRRRVPSGR